MSVQFVDPRGQAATEARTYDHSLDLDGPVTIGLLANGFPDSVEFLEAVAGVLEESLPGATFERWNKNNASASVRPDMLAEIVERCDAVVAAYGH